MSWKRNVLIGVAAFACASAVLLVRELQRVPVAAGAKAGAAGSGPLTDIAGAPRPGTAPLPPPPIIDGPAAAGSVVPPSEMPNAYDPPQWTPPLAVPGQPSPPDPHVPPPIAQDPDRGRDAG
ncbi:MAG: hypothetical protein HYV09_32750 [Deltaproteobacteria bacterium]|nr:hypothetical protein [Deltaproteobacteria bacterium]